MKTTPSVNGMPIKTPETDRERAEKCITDYVEAVDAMSETPGTYPNIEQDFNLKRHYIEQAFTEIRQDERKRCAEIVLEHSFAHPETCNEEELDRHNEMLEIASAIESQGGGE